MSMQLAHTKRVRELPRQDLVLRCMFGLSLLYQARTGIDPYRYVSNGENSNCFSLKTIFTIDESKKHRL